MWLKASISRSSSSPASRSGNLHVEIRVRDALRRVGHRIHRIERAAGQEPSQNAAEHDDHRHQAK